MEIKKPQQSLTFAIQITIELRNGIYSEVFRVIGQKQLNSWKWLELKFEVFHQRGVKKRFIPLKVNKKCGGEGQKAEKLQQIKSNQMIHIKKGPNIFEIREKWNS